MSDILVTGGSGYIASFVIAQLLNEGAQVRTTIRSLAKEAQTRAAIAQLADTTHLTFRAADLNADEGWAQAAEGCAHILHVASPLPSMNPKSDEELVRPARDGALRVLAAARNAGAARVVMTSSTAAVAYGHGSRDTPLTEADWSDPTDRTDSSAYERSKMIAERAAWDWLAKDGGSLELTTICPGAVLGPVLGTDYSASIDIVKKLLDGSLPGLPRFGFPIVDVRDIADLHIRAMRAPAAAGQRYIGAGDFLWMTDVADILRARLPNRRIPSRKLPNWLVRLSAAFDPVVRDRLFELGKHRPVSAARARSELGWTPRPLADTIADTANSLIAANIVKA
jgi:dihydroflavonol-4-reductase